MVRIHQGAPPLAAPALIRFARGLRIEQLSKPLLCVLLVPHWLWLAVRYRSLTLPSSLNPSIETGGLAGESKSACLEQIDAAHSSVVAAWIAVKPGDDPVERRRAAGLTYPVVVKPDIGWCGYGVRRVTDDGELSAYAAAFPRHAVFMVQRFVAGPHEAGLFYVRSPGEQSGGLTAIALRHAPHVIGDGSRTVAALAARLEPPFRGHTARAGEVPPAGERVVLTTVASLRVGGHYEDGSAHITSALNQRIDAIACSMPNFHLGRFDIRFESMAELRQGRFSIIEVNGAGAEAIHLWDPARPLGAAFRGVFAKQSSLFRLGDQMRGRGYAPVGPIALAKAWLRQQRLIARYPPSN